MHRNSVVCYLVLGVNKFNNYTLVFAADSLHIGVQLKHYVVSVAWERAVCYEICWLVVSAILTALCVTALDTQFVCVRAVDVLLSAYCSHTMLHKHD
jgi:hypothetical protein